MAKSYRPVERDQPFLLPPDMRSWLPAGHLVWFVISVVEKLDISAFEARSRRGGVGRAGYDPRMLLTVLIYAYAMGQRSSRQIERLCHTDVAFRVACAQDAPDHTTIARFRQRHEQALSDLFTDVLVLCARSGLGKLGTVAIDGTKIAANASDDAMRSEKWLREQAERILAEAEATDAEEDAVFGDQRGDELPAELTDPTTRDERIRKALADLEAEKAAEEAPARRAD
jgi:transposase